MSSAQPLPDVDAVLAIGRARNRLEVIQSFLTPHAGYPASHASVASAATSAQDDLDDPFSIASLQNAGRAARYTPISPAILAELQACVADPAKQVVVDETLMEVLQSAMAADDGAAAFVKGKTARAIGDRSHFDALPCSVVVYPASTAEVSRLMRVCFRHRVAVNPAGTRTGLEGSSLSIVPGLVLDMSRMHKVLKLCTDEMLIEVQPGIEKVQLNAYLKKEGLFFPVDPGSNACVGGYANTGASGTLSYKYGTMRENCRQMTVVLSDGRVMVTRSRAPKSSVGYNLHQLLMGSEGTLAVVTELVLVIRPLPAAALAARAQFPSTRHVTDFVSALIQAGVTQLARAELLNGIMMRAVNRYSNTAFPEAPTLFLEFHGTTKAEVTAASDKALTLARQTASTVTYESTDNPEEMDTMWQARRDAYFAAFTLWQEVQAAAAPLRDAKGLPPLPAPAAKPKLAIFTTDVCVPLPALTESITSTEDDFAALGLPEGVCCPIVGHVADGNYHCLIPYMPHDATQSNIVTELNDRMVRRALSLRGTSSGEHGVGLGKMRFVAEERGEVAMDLMRKIKHALDPHGIMNPFKVFAPLSCEEGASVGRCTRKHEACSN